MGVTEPTGAISVLGAALRFRVLVITCVLLGALGGYLFTIASSPVYAAVAEVVLAPPPASVTTPGGGSSHLTAAAGEQAQFALIESTAVARAAAATVDARAPGSDLTSTALAAATTVRGPSPDDMTTPSTVTVTLPHAREAALGADAVVAAYIKEFHAQIKQRAAESESELSSQIGAITKQLEALTSTQRATKTSTASTSTTQAATTSFVFPPRSHAAPSGQSGPSPRRARLVATTTTTPTTTTTTSTSSTTTTTSTTSTTTTTTSTTVPSTSTTTVPTTTPTTAPSAGDQAQRTALTATLSRLTQAKAEILVNRAVDLQYDPAFIPARVPTSPSARHTLLDVPLGAVAGLVLGVALACALASSRRRFEGAEDPAALYAAPLLAAVPAFTVAEWTEVALPVVGDPTGEAAEAYRTLATALRARRGASRSLIVAVTACDLVAGTTTTTANVGCALAETGERTVVVDTDTLGRALSRALLPVSDTTGLPQASVGLSDLIEGCPLEDALTPSAQAHGLWVVPSGRDYTMAVRRWRSARLRSVLEEMAEQFDFVVVDTPPVGMTSYALDVVATAGTVVLVVPHHDSVRLHVRNAERLRVSSAELLGYVYNGEPLDASFSPYYPVVPTAAGPPRDGPAPGQPGDVDPPSSGRAPVALHPGAAATAVLDEDRWTDPGPGSWTEPRADPTRQTPPATWPEGYDDETLMVNRVQGAPDETRTLLAAVDGQSAFGPPSRLPWRRRAEEREHRGGGITNGIDRAPATYVTRSIDPPPSPAR